MKKIDFNNDWKFYKVGKEQNVFSVTLPHDAMISEKRAADNAGGKGGAWFEGHDYVYEKPFDVPADFADKKIVFEFEGIYRNAEIYLNGEKIYFRPYGYTNFYVDVSDKLNFGQANAIKVIAHNSELPNTRWYSGAGIYRPVWMYVSDKKHIELNSVKIRTLSINPARIEVKVKSQGEGEVMVSIFDGKNAVLNDAVQTGGEALFVFDIPNAKLWDCDNPHLYQCKIEFGSDIEEVSFGIRQLGLDAKNGFRINGKRVLLKGCCVHHDNGLLGAVAHPFAEERKVKLLKESGYNAIRSAHNPCSKAMLDACDRLGMLMMDEYVDMWYIHKTKHDYANYFAEWHNQDLADIVDKDFNHPSVIMYSIGNEVSETAQPRGIKLTEEMTEYLHKLDDTRFVTCGVNLFFNFLSSMGFGVYSDKKAARSAAPANKPKKEKKKKAVGSEFFNNLAGLLGAKFMKWGASWRGSDRKTKEAFSKLDAAGYNYGEKRYKKDVKKYPERVIVGSETFPFDTYKFIEFSKNHPQLIGDFVWTGIDYLGEVGLGSWEYQDYIPDPSYGPGWIAAGSGRLDITGKPFGEMAYTRVAYELDKIRIAVVPVYKVKQKHTPGAWRMTNAQETWSWNGMSGSPATVEVYVRAYTVKLLINGKVAGIKKTKNDCRAVFNVNYYDGEVTAVGYDSAGNEIAKTSLKTAGEETKLLLLPEKAAYGVNDLCYVRLAYTDNEGNVKPLARGDIKVSVNGGKLLGLGSGCPYNERGFLTDVTDTYYGEALAIIQPQSREVSIHATSAFGNADTTIKIN